MPDDPNAAPENQDTNMEGGDAQLTLEALAEQFNQFRSAADEKEQRWREREQELLRDKARLEGRLEAGNPQQPQFLGSENEYQYAAAALQERIRLADALDKEAERAQAEQQLAHLQANFGMYQRHRQQEHQQAENRRMQRLSFLAKRDIDPSDEIARAVERLHDSGFPLERIEHEFLSPREELRKLRGDEQARSQTTASAQAATQIEGGETRTAPPAPISREDLTPQQATARDLERQFLADETSADKILFDS